MSRLTVVVPVYNVEHYLADCLDSLIAQDFPDFEVVCVNDGSTDGSAQVLGRYAAHDSRFVVIAKPNGGLSSARNAGIRAATGDYICFLDSDDRLAPEACGRIVSLLDTSGADVLTFGGRALPPEASYAWLEHVLTPRDAVFEGLSPQLMFHESSTPFVWRTALRRTFLTATSLLFDERVRYGEDQVFQFGAYARAHRVRLASDRLYHYRVGRKDSLMDRMSRNQRSMMLEHARIVHVILADWGHLGVLHDMDADAVSWTIAYVAHNALALKGDGCRQVLDAWRDELLRHWEPGDLREMELPAAERHVLNHVLSDAPIGPLLRRQLLFSLDAHAYGRRTALRRLMHGKT